jgi:cytochrome P450
MPNSFLPDRFLTPEQRISIGSVLNNSSDFVHNTAAFIPFSYGPANCVGKALGMIELRMVACHLIQRFEMQFPKGWDPATYGENLRDDYVMGKGELQVVLTPRKASKRATTI